MPGILAGKYVVKNTIEYNNSSRSKIKLGFNSETGEEVNIKIMNNNISKETWNAITETKALQRLGYHPNIVHLYEYGQGTYQKESSDKERSVYYIVQESNRGGGNVFDYLHATGAFTEMQARYYFQKLIAGLYHCHQNGFTHRNLSTQNLLLDQENELKITDFSYAAPINGRDGKGFYFSKVGHHSFMAPEIHLLQAYEGSKIDVFAAGVILFTMVSAQLPFSSATTTDPYYKCLVTNTAQFWDAHCKNKLNTNEYYSSGIKDLIQRMLTLDPQGRPSIDEIIAHPWMQDELPNQLEIFADFHIRNKKLDHDKQIFLLQQLHGQKDDSTPTPIAASFSYSTQGSSDSDQSNQDQRQ